MRAGQAQRSDGLQLQAGGGHGRQASPPVVPHPVGTKLDLSRYLYHFLYLLIITKVGRESFPNSTMYLTDSVARGVILR